MKTSIKIPDYDSIGYIVNSSTYLSYSGRTSLPTFVNYFRMKDFSTSSNRNNITYGGPGLLVAPNYDTSNGDDSKYFGDTGDIAVGYNSCSLVRYRRYLSNQYGGYEHQARTKQEYISCSNLIDIQTTSISVHQGDVFIGYSNMLMNKATSTLTPTTDGGSEAWGQFSNKLLMPLETTTNTDIDTGLKFNAWYNMTISNSTYTNIPEVNNLAKNIIILDH